MPRAGESQLLLSVRQEGSGAMRMLLRAAYSLTHEPENSFRGSVRKMRIYNVKQIFLTIPLFLTTLSKF